jgi:hypothetical protein
MTAFTRCRIFWDKISKNLVLRRRGKDVERKGRTYGIPILNCLRGFTLWNQPLQPRWNLVHGAESLRYYGNFAKKIHKFPRLAEGVEELSAVVEVVEEAVGLREGVFRDNIRRQRSV